MQLAIMPPVASLELRVYVIPANCIQRRIVVKTYVVDKDGKVVEMKATITQAEKKEGCKFVLAWDRKGTDKVPPGEFAEGDKIPAENLVPVEHAIEIMQAPRTQLVNFMLQNMKR